MQEVKGLVTIVRFNWVFRRLYLNEINNTYIMRVGIVLKLDLGHKLLENTKIMSKNVL